MTSSYKSFDEEGGESDKSETEKLTGTNKDDDEFIVQKAEKNYLADDFTIWQGLTAILQQSTWPVIGYIFHPMYMLINARILGNFTPDPKLCGADASSAQLNSYECISGEHQLESFGLASATLGIFYLAPGICYSLALGNVIPQAYGAGNFRLCGAYLNRVIITQIMIFTPLMTPMFFTEPLFLFLVGDPGIAHLASLYCKFVAPGMLFFFIGTNYSVFASCHGITYLSVLTTTSASLFHFCLTYVLCHHYHWGMLGIAISSGLQFVIRFLVPYFLVQWNQQLQKSLIPIYDQDSWNGFGEIVKLGGISVMLNVMGWWAFDVFTLMASQLTDTDIAAQTILRNIGLFTFMIPVGFKTSTTFFTGRYIGRNKIDMAKRISTLCMWVTFSWSLTSMTVCWFGAKPILTFYTDNLDVIKVMEQAWYVFCIFVFFDCMQGVAAGLISGLGLMKKVKWLTAFDYWVIGIPVSTFFMFHEKLGIQGLWWGPTVAVAMNYVLYSYVMYTSDWQVIADEIVEKMNADKEEMDTEIELEKTK